VKLDQVISQQISEESVLPRSGTNIGFLTEKQYQVLEMRYRGYTQREIAQLLGISRAGVSMIEGRARKQIRLARITLGVYDVISKNQHNIVIPVGTRLQKIPVLLLQEADNFQIHIQYNMVEISRMVRKQRQGSLSNGLTTKEITIFFNQRGLISI
jgi:HTH-type transcriptional regulator, fmd operon transcriptional regulator